MCISVLVAGVSVCYSSFVRMISPWRAVGGIFSSSHPPRVLFSGFSPRLCVFPHDMEASDMCSTRMSVSEEALFHRDPRLPKSAATDEGCGFWCDLEM